MKPITFFILTGLAVSMFGCGSLVQDVNPDNIPTGTAKLVVHSYISPQDTVLAVSVELPKAVIGQRPVYNGYQYRRPFALATVDLADGARTVRLVYSAKDELYRAPISSLPIVAGRTYTLTVSTPYDYPSIKASCTVPVPVAPSSIQLDSIYENQYGQNQMRYISRLRWQDPAGQANYYKVVGQAFRTQKQPIYNAKPPRDTVITNTETIYFQNSSLFSDKGIDGEQFISPKADYANYNGSSNSGLVQLRVVMTLNSVDENYYRYHDAIDRQQTANDNPFAEPVLLPSNIQNGLGCFGAFNQASLTVKVR
ncbi:DUF4249 domain-containing protein [Fibrella aquatilis]|uniref:DUF4249 domain-containing protein n=1 Tax=Fibrella aquatilis TaxID=2817059 RepID=A0A939G7E3_9BACT|nr:DUF4249 domain-containing protein [Fibrella aquatilis]MBO0931401.1 DUF4249 domain-containing protein [Fibrella aquatilis]